MVGRNRKGGLNMAHDRQYKDNPPLIIDGMVCGRFNCPKKGDKYYNRYNRCIEIAETDLTEKFIIMGKQV